VYLFIIREIFRCMKIPCCQMLLVVIILSCLGGCSYTISPKQYCYTCCACVGTGALNIRDSSHFEIEYEYGDHKKHEEKIYAGKGTYQQEKRNLFLYFDDQPDVPSRIELIRQRDSDSLIVNVLMVTDPIHGDTLQGAQIVLKNRPEDK